MAARLRPRCFALRSRAKQSVWGRQARLRCSHLFLGALAAAFSLALAPAASAERVQQVIDGDTVRLADGRLVRYIGIDTPELRRKVDGRWVKDPQPFAREARQANERLVLGKDVRLEYDIERLDRYGRTLAYVYAAGEGGAEVMVNAELLRLGYAQQMTIPPNVRYAERFRALVQEARGAQRGLWRPEPPEER